MFGRNDFVENVKSALAAVDCDMGAFRSWQKMYDKLKKKKSEQEDRYRRCREQTKRVQPGEECLAALYIDKSSRLCATMKVYEYLKKEL